MSSFETNLRRLRIQQNMKQEDLALKMHVTRQTVSGWETGRRQPDLETLKTLAQVLEVDIHELIYGCKPQEYPKYQKRYRVQTAICGGVSAGLLLFHLFIYPSFQRLCATNHWGFVLFICQEVLPLLGAYCLGAGIPSLLRLFIQVHIEKKKAKWFAAGGLAALLPAALLWLGVYPFTRWFLYPAGHAIISYLLPIASGVGISLAIGSDKD